MLVFLPGAGEINRRPAATPMTIVVAEDALDVEATRPAGSWRLRRLCGLQAGRERLAKSAELAHAANNPLVPTQNHPQCYQKHPGALGRP